MLVLLLLLVNPRALLGQPTKEKREEGGRLEILAEIVFGKFCTHKLSADSFHRVERIHVRLRAEAILLLDILQLDDLWKIPELLLVHSRLILVIG